MEVWGGVIGRQGEVAENGNGKRLLQFCAENELVVINTCMFQHKDIHKFTWECRRKNQRSIVDYFLVRKDMKGQLRDVKVVRGAEIGSDHYLVLMVITLKVKVEKPIRSRVAGGSIRVKRLRNKEVRWQFQTRLMSRYNVARQMVGKDVEAAWAELKEGILRSAVEVCGETRVRRERRRTAWWSKEVQEAVRAKKLAYRKLLDQGSEEAKVAYNEAKKEAKMRVRKAKNEEWREHFDNLLNGEAGSGEESTADGNEVQNEEGGIEVEKVDRAVRKLKSGKSGGVCSIQVEMVKAGGYTMVQWLKEVFDIAWKCAKTPHEWREAIIVPIYKKGSRDECGNYRGISLLSVVGKIYARVVCDRLRVLTDAVLMDEQGGFRVHRGCVDQIFAVRQVIEKVIEKDKVAYAAFVDLEKAYDSVSRSKLWVALKDYGVKGQLLAAVQSFYEEGWARVRVAGKESSPFQVWKGVR